MTGQTSRYGLSTLGQGESLAADGYKFTGPDRDVVDYLLARGAELHRHDGATVGNDAPDTAPNLTLESVGGALPPGTRIYYKYTYVVDGHESVASPEAYVDTPAQVAVPGQVTISAATVGGNLLPGTYYYVVTAYKTSNTLETQAADPNFVKLTGVAPTNQAELTMPSLPAGATGFNLYVRKPGQSKYFYLASTTSSTYTHDGSDAQDCDRSVPSRNSTNSSNAVVVSMPGATPAVPLGATWKLYRTYSPGNYNRSLLVHVVEAIAEGSATITPFITDIGIPTSNGRPPTSSLTVTNPQPINLATEVTGLLATARINALPIQVTFTVPGPVITGTTFSWVNHPYGQVRLGEIQAVLQPGSSPAGQPVILDVYVGTADLVPVYTDQFASELGRRPAIDVGNERSAHDSWTVDPATSVLLGPDEILSIRVAQDGGGATPSDLGLSIAVYLWVTVP